MPYHRISIRTQGAVSSLEIDGKPMMPKRTLIDIIPGKPPTVTMILEPSALELDGVLQNLSIINDTEPTEDEVIFVQDDKVIRRVSTTSEQET